MKAAIPATCPNCSTAFAVSQRMETKCACGLTVQVVAVPPFRFAYECHECGDSRELVVTEHSTSHDWEETVKAKPCPFCGTEPTIEEPDEGEFVISCQNPSCAVNHGVPVLAHTGLSAWGVNRDILINRWNARKP